MTKMVSSKHLKNFQHSSSQFMCRPKSFLRKGVWWYWITNMWKKFDFSYKGHAVRGWPNFRDVFLISALEGDGVEAVRVGTIITWHIAPEKFFQSMLQCFAVQDYLLASAITSPWAFNGEILTDCPPAELCLRIVKSKMLEHLQDEIPYILHPQLEFWDTNDEGERKVFCFLLK